MGPAPADWRTNELPRLLQAREQSVALSGMRWQGFSAPRLLLADDGRDFNRAGVMPDVLGYGDIVAGKAEGSALDERNGHADSQADELQGGAARLYLGELWAVEGEPRADALDALRLWAEDLGRSGLSVSEGGVLDERHGDATAHSNPHRAGRTEIEGMRRLESRVNTPHPEDGGAHLLWVQRAEGANYVPAFIPEADLASAERGALDASTPEPAAATPGPRDDTPAVDVRSLICGYPWPCEEALAVFECESHLDPGAIDPTAENFGLSQLNESVWRPYFGEQKWALVLDARGNLEMAWEVYSRGGGWGPWACRP